MNYSTIVIIHRNHKSITFFLADGESLSWDNIIDVEVHEMGILNADVNKNEVCKYENEKEAIQS